MSWRMGVCGCRSSDTSFEIENFVRTSELARMRRPAEEVDTTEVVAALRRPTGDSTTGVPESADARRRWRRAGEFVSE